MKLVPSLEEHFERVRFLILLDCYDDGVVSIPE